MRRDIYLKHLDCPLSTQYLLCSYIVQGNFWMSHFFVRIIFYRYGLVFFFIIQLNLVITIPSNMVRIIYMK